MSSTLNIKAKEIQTVDREKAKQLSLAFYDIYHSSTPSNTIHENFKLLFDATNKYFSYIEACNEFIKYLIKLEEQLFQGQGTVKYSDEAEIALKNTDAVKWIHDEVSMYLCISDINIPSLVKKLQKKNELLKIKPGVMEHFYSLTPERYSVSQLKNKENELKSTGLAKIKVFSNLIATLFKRVVPPKGIKELTTVVLNQYDLPQLECDYFFIFKELLNIYQQENHLQKNSNLANLFKQNSKYIISNQKELEFKSFSQFEKTHKHYVIKTLTRFALNEEDIFTIKGNLTQLNNEAFKYFIDYKNLNNYLHYLDKLWLLDTPRENAKSLLDSDKQLIVDEEINKFLSLSFGESINRIYNYFFKNKTIDVQLSQIEQKFIVSQGITANQLKISIHNEVKKACSTFKSVNEVPLSRAISLANAWSTCNRNKSAYLELLYRVILRLIINLEEDAEKDHVISIERAIEEELCCIHRQFYFNYTIVELFGSDFKEVIESKYEEYRTDMYTVFKLWLCFLISQETTKTPLESIQVIIDKYFPLFINHSSKPTTLKVFLDTDKKEIHVPKVETLININDADLDMFIDSSSNKFLVSSLLKDQLSDNGIEITEFEKFTSDKYLTALWSNILGVDTKELVTLTLLQNFIEVGGKGKEKGKDAKYFASRGKIREAFIVKRRGALFQMLNAQTFSSIIFNYNKSFEDKLKNKIEVLSHVSSLESDRYDIENKLGQGAFGVVYKAKDLMFESIVAIKLIPHWFHSEGVSKRLIKEAAIMRNSQHENVVVVYDLVKLPAHKLTISEECKLNHLHVFDDNEEVFALVMEEINGGVTLEQHILSTDWKSLSYEQKLDFFQDICFGVKSLHNQGVVHGDIKPQNILVGKNGKPKIADFGIASSSGDKSIGITNPTFISINKLNGGKSDFQDDIYSLGMLLLYLFSPSIVNEFKRKNVNKLIVEKELLHLALLSLNANANSDGYYKKGYIHRYTFPDSQILELMDDDIAEIFLEDPIAKHSYYKDVVHNIDINTFNDGEWDKPNLYLYSLIEVIFRCISTKGSTTKARLYNLVNELHPSNENYIHIEELYLNTNNVQDINELIFEIKSAANSDVLEFNYNDYRCLKLPTYLNEVLTLENLEFYSKHINFEELCKISANYKLNDITFLGGTKYDNNNTFLWTVGNKLYKGSSAGLENYFGEALYKTKLLKVMGQTYGDLFSFVHDVLELEMIPNRCLSLLTNIKPCLSYKPFSLGSLKRRDCSQYKLPEKLGENITLFYKVEEAFILYQEVLNVFLNSGKEVDIEFESDDDYANALSTGASTVEPPTFSGNVIEFNAKLTSGEQLSLIQDDNLIASINAFVSTKVSKSFNRFYGSCFDYQKLRKSVVEWKQLDNENAIDEYIDVKTQYIGSIEYELLQMYVRSGDKEIHIFSR